MRGVHFHQQRNVLGGMALRRGIGGPASINPDPSSGPKLLDMAGDQGAEQSADLLKAGIHRSRVGPGEPMAGDLPQGVLIPAVGLLVGLASTVEGGGPG